MPLNPRIEMRMGAHRAAQLADSHPFQRLRESLFRPAEFIEHERELQPEGDRLGVNAVTPPNHRRHLVTARLVADHAAQIADVVEQDFACLAQLNRKRGIENVGGSKPLMNPACGRANRRRHVFQKRDDIVIRALLDFVDLGNRKARALSDFLRVRVRDLSDRRHCLAGERFDLEPDFEFPLLGPEFAHRGAGITIDHRVNIEKRAARGKAIRGKKKRRSDERTVGATSCLDYPKIL